MTDENTAGEREHQVNRILADYLEAQRLGQTPNREDLLRQHPDVADELRSFFDDQDRFGRLAEPLGPPAVPAKSVAVLGTVRYFGDYELLEEIARGGMGVVYKARQVSLNRTVALKMILAGHFAAPEDVQRFRREAEAAGNLDHPNIVPIYEIGEQQGQHYFSMKLVAGGSLASRAMPLPARQAAVLVATVSRAVHHAHQRGVLHRDLKPGNILLDAQGQPYVTDFGLARRVEGDVRHTRTGGIVGTASYMPPEQARAEKVLTTGVDVYSLGAILYELLTGRPPFRAETPLDTVLQVLERDPEPPRKVDPRIDRDLETICLKCLGKDPQRRYDSAAALADDLERWLNGEPIVARPAGRLERTWRWCKRRPAVALLLALLLLAQAAVVTVSVSFAVYYAKTAARLDAARKDAEQVASAATQDKAVILGEQGNEEAGLWLARCLEHEVSAGLSPEEQRYIRLYLTVWSQQRNPRLVRLDGDQAFPFADFSPDGKLALMYTDRTVALWDTATGKQVTSIDAGATDLRVPQFSSDGRTILTRNPTKADFNMPDGERIQFWDASSGKQRGEVVSEYGARSQHFALSPDFALAVAWARKGAEARLVHTPTGQVRSRFTNHTGVITNAWFSPDGSRVVTCGEDRTARLWDTASGKLLHTLAGHEASVIGANFSDDGELLLTSAAGHNNGVVRLWSTESGRLIGQTPRHEPPYEYEELRTDFVPRTQWFVTAYKEKPKEGEGPSDRGQIAYWDRQTLGPVAGLGKYIITDVSPDGRKAAAQSEKAIWLMDTATLRPISRQEYTSSVLADVFTAWSRAQFSADSSVVLLIMGRLDYWRLLDAGTGRSLGAPLRGLEEGRFSPDGRALVICRLGGERDETQEFQHFSLVPVGGSPESITLWVQTLLGKELTPTGEVHLLDEEELQSRRQRLAELGGPPLLP